MEELWEFGISISAGQLSNILTKNHDQLNQEKEALLIKARQQSSYFQVDDTRARHNGKNGYCTFIGNHLFSYFKSTDSKSRINFLELLNGIQGYSINDYALKYMTSQSLSPKYLTAIEGIKNKCFTSTEEFQATLEALSIDQKYAVRIITEAALLGYLLNAGMSEDMVILSDDAGQFNILTHALCWIHVERNLQKIHAYTPGQREELDQVLKTFWELYLQLKAYEQKPNNETKELIVSNYDHICDWQTSWIALQKGLDKLKTYKQELLVCLQYPATPLHNNQSERDIREYVKKRKISGSTRSSDGRKARDTFTSLKKTCRKLNISFWDFLNDRLTMTNKIAFLPDLLVD